jgi:hypothetical protein
MQAPAAVRANRLPADSCAETDVDSVVIPLALVSENSLI